MNTEIPIIHIFAIKKMLDSNNITKAIFSDTKSLLKSKGDIILLNILIEELCKDQLEVILTEIGNNNWEELDARVAIHLDEFIDAEIEVGTLDQIYPNINTLHILGEPVDKDHWQTNIFEQIRFKLSDYMKYNKL